MQAVLEGVAFNFAVGQEALYEAHATISEVSVVGGGARSLYWGKILASSVQRELCYRSDREVGAALGAARLAWLGVNGGDAATAFPLSPIQEIVKPDPILVDKYKN
jgi:xylulokinase